MSMTQDEATPHRSRRERSTRYPGVPLSDCVELCKFIESRGLDGLTAADIATALGYKNIKTNTFSARLSAARQFGLIDLSNEGYSLTMLAKSILHPVDPSDLPRLHRQALIEPPIYAELVERLAEKRVPDPAILGNVLYHNHHIIASAKESAAEAFLASARFAGALGDDLILRLGGPSAPTAPAPAPAPAPVAEPIKAVPAAVRAVADVRIDLRLWGDDSGKVIRVRAPESITSESFDRLLQALRLHVRIEGPTGS
jgi:hypothetical protein